MQAVLCPDKLEPPSVYLVGDFTAIKVKDARPKDLLELAEGNYRVAIIVDGKIEVPLGTLSRDEIFGAARNYKEFDRGDVYVTRVDDKALRGEDGSRVA